MSNNPKTYVSIATYNERENIEKLITEIFNLNTTNLSIIIIDDNSPDGTAEIIEKLKLNFANLKLIRRPNKMGYGSAHLLAFKAALVDDAEIIISMDADFSHEPRKITELIHAITMGADVAIGSRKVAGGKIVGWNNWRKFCSAGAMITSQLILGIKTKDLTSGFRAYRHEVLEVIDLNQIASNGYSFLEEIIYLIEKKNFKITEVPITFHDRRLGKSKLSKKEIVNFFITILKIKFNYKR